MLATIVICAVLLGLAVLAALRIRKKGACDGCEGCSGEAACHCKDAPQGR